MQPTCDTCRIKAVAAKAKAMSEMPADERIAAMHQCAKRIRQRSRTHLEQCKP